MSAKAEMSMKGKLQPFLSALLRYHDHPDGHFIVDHARFVDVSSKQPDDEAAVLRFYAARLSQFDNPCVAATEEWVREMDSVFGSYTRVRKGDVEAYFGPGVTPPARQGVASGPITDPEIAKLIENLKFDVVCDFVLEGLITREEGERYFGRLAAGLRKVLAEQRINTEKAPGFATFLEERRIQREAENPA